MNTENTPERQYIVLQDKACTRTASENDGYIVNEFSQAEPGFKVMFIPELKCGAQFEKEYSTMEEAEAALEVVAQYTKMLHECSLMPDYSNVGMVLKRDENGHWIEIDADGNEI